ncbi:MAG TPA: hydroxymethylpyrimidine/phosphomethylpyrimidine kinase [Ghiorsea sp.]|nr:hydroxymethylpyrimidine/phosphomethylpyrimidine kinase [Ghiorsea sp.]
MVEQRPVCLSVGGSDSCAGAGIQADLRVFEALDVQGCSAITALTAQNPENILHIQASSITQFEAELQAISSYYNVACIKTGMLYDQTHIEALIPFIGDIPLIVDPVLIASSNTFLFDKETAKDAYEKLISLATLWTPNLQEASFFLRSDIVNAQEAARLLFDAFHTPVLLKGGHKEANTLHDVLCMDGILQTFSCQKQSLSISAAHGTGCRLASAIAAHIALGNALPLTIKLAHRWLQSDLQQANK